MLNINGESDITIQKKKLSKISSLLKKQTNEKALNNPKEITIVNSNDGKTQKIEIQNKQNSMNNIKVDHPDKNYTVPIQLCQDPSELVKSNKSSSQEKSNQTHQINQQFNEDSFYVEDSDIPVNPNTLKLDEELLNENLLKKKSSLNQKKKKNNCIQNTLKCLTQCFKSLRKYFCCKQNPTSISTIQNEVYSDQQQIITFDDQQPQIEQYDDQKLRMLIDQLLRENLISQQNNSQEDFNKMISNILEYDFAEFEQEDQQNQVSQIYDENLESDIQHNIIVQFRKWNFDTFNQLNQNLRQNFVQNQDMILLELRKFNYFICKQFYSQYNMDLFVGYFQSNRGVNQIDANGALALGQKLAKCTNLSNLTLNLTMPSFLHLDNVAYLYELKSGAKQSEISRRQAANINNPNEFNNLNSYISNIKKITVIKSIQYGK
ncbi:hypothetical protein ABPG73_006511 [Tetrahymena malaccensis]